MGTRTSLWRDVCVMISFLQICNEVTEKLGRRLHENEVKFLQSMYERYTKEQLAETKQRDEYFLNILPS